VWCRLKSLILIHWKHTIVLYYVHIIHGKQYSNILEMSHSNNIISQTFQILIR
jgi:hypothetical protein